MKGAVLGLVLLTAAGCRLARDTAGDTTWTQRGETVGDYAYLYCTRAAPREQQLFNWGLERSTGPHHVTIICERDKP